MVVKCVLDESIFEKLYAILNELPDENSYLDYKEIPYLDKQRTEFIRDLCAFLNSNESYGEDKFIILGVTNDKQLKGINNVPMQDDCWYQNLANYIFPRPSIKTGTFKYKVNEDENDFGYILIYGTNTDRIYEINRQAYYGPEKPSSNDEKEEYSVYPSTAWIRMGSSKYPLAEYDRRKIYEMNKKNNINFTPTSSIYYDINASSENDKILKTVIIFGGWDETNENDKEVISNFIGKKYDDWILKLRTILKDKNSILEYKNNKWKIKDKNNIIKKYAPDFFQDELEIFKNSAINILSERNPKFDLESDKRSMSNIYKKNTKYSDFLRKSIAETLPIITANYRNFDKCKNYAANLPLLVVRKVLENNNWEIWASIGELLPLLAESAPEEFLQQLDYKLKNNNDMIRKLFSEKEYYVTTYNYSTGLYWALELTAWESRNLIESCMLLSKIAKFDKEAIKHIANIILPWYPQTKAPIENRIIVVQNILKESPDDGWELLKNLMPGVITIASPSYKPKWNNIIEENNDKVLKSDYWKQIEIYIDLAILNSKTNTKKICDLIDIMDNVPKYLFDKIFDKLSSNEIKTLNENRKFVIWNHLEDFITWHKRTNNFKDSLPNEAIKKLELLSSNIKPHNILIFARRYFRKDTWHLIDDRKDYKVGENKLHQIQIELVQELLTLEFDKFINFVKSVEDSHMVGICTVEVKNNDKLEFEILNCLENRNKSLVEFAKGYVYKKFTLNGYSWIRKLNIYSWSKTKKLNLLLVLPCTKKTFDLIGQVLNKNESDYWKKIDIRFVKETSELNYAIKKLLAVKRPDRALWIISSKLYEDKNCDYDRETTIKCLKEMIHHQENLNNLDAYYITKIISDLQQSDVPKDELFSIEWIYLPLLNGEEYRPKVIEETLANDPNVYNDILCLAYKPHSLKNNPQKVDEKVATNAYRLLNQWELVPGLENGTINKEKLNLWYNKMIKICTKSDRLEVALSNFGKVLFHSPKDKSGFWIDKNVAEILNQENADIIRKGFYTEASNSLGVINYDPEGSVFENKSIEYNEKANLADKEGFYRLAKEMRKLADTYKYEAENIRDHYFDYE